MAYKSAEQGVYIFFFPQQNIAYNEEHPENK